MTKNTTIRRMALHTLFLSLALVGSSWANVQITFTESAPKDRFTIANTGTCDLQNVTLELDLADSAGALLFDTEQGGQGVEVFQPFEAGDGGHVVLNGSRVEDGARSLLVRIETLGAEQQVSFTIDVDDTLPKSELGNIRVSDSEIEGSSVVIEAMGVAGSAQFSDAGQALVLLKACG